MSKELYSNVAIGFLSGSINSSTTSATLIDSSMFPATGNFMLRCDDELIAVTANNTGTNVLTIARGQESTTGAAHADNAPIFAVFTAGSLRRLVIKTANAGSPSARRQTNFVDGGGVAWTITDDSTNDSTDVSAVVSAGGGYEETWVAPPASSAFTWVNQGGATVTDDSKGFYLTVPAATGNNMRGIVKTAPTAPYTLTVRAIPAVWNGGSGVAGIVLRETSSGKLIRFGWNGVYVLYDKMTNPTSYSGGYGAQECGTPHTNWMWLRVQDDNTNRILSMSQDGLYWHQLHSVSRTDFCTPDQVGVMCESAHASLESAIRLLSWNVT